MMNALTWDLLALIWLWFYSVSSVYRNSLRASALGDAAVTCIWVLFDISQVAYNKDVIVANCELCIITDNDK